MKSRVLAAILLLCCVPALRAEEEKRPLQLRLVAETFRPLEPAGRQPIWYDGSPQRESASGHRFLVAIARSPLDQEQRRLLRAAGAEILGYLPVHGYRLRLSPGSEAKLRKLPFLPWIGELPPHFKVTPELSLRAERIGGPTRVRIILNRGEPERRVLSALGDLPSVATPAGKDGAWRVLVTIPADQLAALLLILAGLPEVESLELARPVRPLNQDAVWVHQSFVGSPTFETPIFDRGVYGCGQVVAVADTGQDFDACQFHDSSLDPPLISSCTTVPCPAATPDLNQRKNIIYYNWSGTPTGDDDTCPGFFGSGHGTHTSGSVAGDQAPYADCVTFSTPGGDPGDGVAPGAKLVIEEMGDLLEYLNELGGTVWNLSEVAHQSEARILSISWGGVCHDLFGGCIPGCTLPYDSLSRDADEAMWTFPDLLIVKSAGNAGDFCPPPVAISTPSIAKNLLTVGSLGHGANANTPSSFSSDGPVFDGRLKPTVAAQGEATVSALSDPLTANACSTCQLSGTSMAAPTTAGLAALVREYFTAGFYATGGRDASQGIVPSGALLKAMLIDGAVPLGSTAPGPDFDSGYGRLQLDSTLSFTGSPFTIRVDDFREGMTTGSVVTHAFDVGGGTPLRATLVWTDPPAELNAAIARINELRLEVIDPGGELWFQTINPSSGLPEQTMQPADPHDALNVEERLVFDDPTDGRWVFRVRGIDVPIDPQPFALVVRGALTDCPSPAAPAAPALATPDDQQVQVTWAPITDAATYNVYRSFDPCPGGPKVQIASAVTETSFLDTHVSGDVSYSYFVTAASDTTGFCESVHSSCASVVPTGDCILPPLFNGVETAASAALDTCTVSLGWDPATPVCGSDVRYNVYRSLTPGFTPGPANRIARCLLGTSFADAVDLTRGIDYHYIVRAEDSSSGGGGPCRDGNEETNLLEIAAAPGGPLMPGSWNDDAGDTGAAQFQLGSPWVVDAAGGDSGPAVYKVHGSSGQCADLTSPALTLGDPGGTPQLSFSTRHTLEYEEILAAGSIGQVEIATAPDFDDWSRLDLNPDYPTNTQFISNGCPTTQTFNVTYFTDIDNTFSTYTADLTDYAGEGVKIRFHMSGDNNFAGGEWWVDDIVVDQTAVMGACTSVPAGPPPIPDGASVPGEPLRVTASGSDLLLTWDATRCAATAVNIYYGALGDYTTFTGGFCDLPPTGSATVSLPDNVWFVVVATDGLSTDGSWSRDALGVELNYGGASLVCPAITRHLTNNTCL